MLLLVLLLMFLTKPSYAAENNLIIPGNSVAGIPLTIQPDEMITQLGHPTSVEPSGDLLMVGFKDLGLMFIYNKQANLLFMITFNLGHKDSRGIGVNASAKKVADIYGDNCKKMEQGVLITWLYLERGIGFTFDKGKVISVWVFQGTDKTIDT